MEKFLDFTLWLINYKNIFKTKIWPSYPEPESKKSVIDFLEHLDQLKG